MKNKYILTPQNEGQELSCRVKINCSKKEAVKVATKMAGEIHAALLLQADIGVMVQTESEGLRGDAGIIARWDGKVLDGQTGNQIKI